MVFRGTGHESGGHEDGRHKGGGHKGGTFKKRVDTRAYFVIVLDIVILILN